MRGQDRARANDIAPEPIHQRTRRQGDRQHNGDDDGDAVAAPAAAAPIAEDSGVIDVSCDVGASLELIGLKGF